MKISIENVFSRTRLNPCLGNWALKSDFLGKKKYIYIYILMFRFLENVLINRQKHTLIIQSVEVYVHLCMFSKDPEEVCKDRTENCVCRQRHSVQCVTVTAIY